MRTDALLQRYEIFVSAAIVAAHASSARAGFRQRDVRFLIELFSNWVESSLEGTVIELSNTQVMRYLDSLIEEGYLRRVGKGSRPLYRLARVGLIELITRIVHPERRIEPQHIFFCYYFIKSYRPKIVELIKNEGKQFPTALKIEVEHLLDSRNFLEEQITALELSLKKVESRLNESIKTSQIAKKLYNRGESNETVTAEIERLFPYELNSQKPLSELLGGMPADLGRWELEIGGDNRAVFIFGPTKRLLQGFLGQLKELRKLE